MSRNLTSSDRSALIRLASGLPSGDRIRKAILNSLKANFIGLRLPAGKADVERIQGILNKAQGNEIRILGLASTMASSIDDWTKAERRGSAAEKVLPEDAKLAELIAGIFWDRADQLKGSDGASVAPSTQETGESLKGSLDAYAIPMGAVNLMTGDNRVFNFVQEWGSDGDSSVLTICEDLEGRRKILLCGSGGASDGFGRGMEIKLHSDQSGGFLGYYVVLKDVIGRMSLDLLKQVSHSSGMRSIPAYVLK